MKQIAKRFELINIAISLNEKDIISSQIKKIRSFGLNEEARYIINLLENEAYSKASDKIRNYLRNISNANAYIDTKLQELQVQLSTLKKDYNSLVEAKNESIREINEFITLFHINLGEIISEILKAQFKNAKKAYKEAKTSRDIYDSVKSKYESFIKSEEKQQSQSSYSLNVDEKSRLKKLYKKANRQINPDILLDKFKQRTEKMHSALNSAFLKQDLATIEKIKKTIDENPQSVYGYDKIDNKNAIKVHLKELREKISGLKDDLDEMQKSEIYTLLHSINNLQEYFMNIKKYLITQKSQLMRQIS